MVSIIIPVYNGEKFIAKAVKSAINQTYRDIEIIVIDDGSTDNTKEIVKQYDVKYIYQNNSGPSIARNNGIKISKGEYIAFLDADDIYMTNKIERQIQEFEKDNELGIVYNAVRIIDENDNLGNVLSAELVLDNKDDFYAYSLFRQIIPCPPSIMVKKSCFKKVLYPSNLINAEDYFFTLEMAKRFKFKYIDEILYLYRRHDMNLTNKHLLQVETEIDIVKSIGKKEIKEIINKSNFSKKEKDILYIKVLMKIRDYIEAEEFLENIISNKNSDANALFYLGNCKYKLNKFEEAKNSFKNALNIDENLAEVHNNLGCVYKLLNVHDLAIDHLKKALSIRPKYMDAAFNIESINDNNVKVTERELRKTLTNYRLK
ncbi:TPR repeat-containing protein [Clostridium cavendishii DSM 21758]|uniref:TPR repeat-containing protein n=1 Tax=Clostridium cavendishii DSM 21758 TaxID=1121302 RepID=A0A1M6AZ82_9CLOT|nr:glycosyltransferase [Clostridium cavendishii]SHI41741.1 TPR repeat-containing protein [Clostridium cavendishii DSM 21758]